MLEALRALVLVLFLAPLVLLMALYVIARVLSRWLRAYYLASDDLD
jgi:small-conductance mechanosensitive channel